MKRAVLLLSIFIISCPFTIYAFNGCVIPQDISHIYTEETSPGSHVFTTATKYPLFSPSGCHATISSPHAICHVNGMAGEEYIVTLIDCSLEDYAVLFFSGMSIFSFLLLRRRVGTRSKSGLWTQRATIPVTLIAATESAYENILVTISELFSPGMFEQLAAFS